MIQYKNLTKKELCPELFQHFIRRQEVVNCWRKENNKWIIKKDPFIDDWTEDDYKKLISCLEHTYDTDRKSVV